MKKYIRNRFYFRGATPLGILNTVLAWLLNRVLILYIDDADRVLDWSIGVGTDFPPDVSPMAAIKDHDFYVKTRNGEIVRFIFLAMFVIVLGCFVFGRENFVDAVSNALITVGVCILLSTFFIENSKEFSIKISAPIGVVFLVLFVAVPIPALLFPKDAVLGFGGSLVISGILIWLCVWFSGKLVRRG